jgi:hypothetical protein
MPEQYRRPSWHEANLRIERMLAKRRAERDALATVRRFNAKLSAGRAVWFWPKIGAALTAKCPWLYVLCEGCGTIIDLGSVLIKRLRSVKGRDSRFLGGPWPWPVTIFPNPSGG